MGKLKITPGGGGADLDVVNAGAGDVLAGKVIVDKEGEPLVGGIPGRSAATITPSTANQIINAGQYLSGAQTILGDPNLQAANIKKGVTIFGKTGNFQGYVDSPLYFYNKGVWSNLQTTKMTMISGIVLQHDANRFYTLSNRATKGGLFSIRLNQTVNLSAYNYINIRLTAAPDNKDYTETVIIGISADSAVNDSRLLPIKTVNETYGFIDSVMRIDISSISGDYYIYIGGFAHNTAITLYVTEIYLTTV